MVENLLGEYVQIRSSIASWQEAIQLGAEPLLTSGVITESYIHAMIANVEENGPYIVIMPYVALPHSRVEDGALKTAISIMKLNEAVMFPKNNPVKLIVVLAATENEVHMQILSELCDVFMDDEKMEKILNAVSVSELLRYLS